MKIVLSFLLLFSVSSALQAQKYLVIDRYGPKRIKLKEGDLIRFRQKGNKTYYRDVILALKDSTVVLEKAGLELPLSDFASFRFPNSLALAATGGGGFVGTGFLISSAVYPAIEDPQYDQKESAVIGASFLGLATLGYLARWKTYRIGKRARVRIVDTTFRKVEENTDSEEENGN